MTRRLNVCPLPYSEPEVEEAVELYLARHGETRENVEGIVQGHSYGRLTRNGHEQAAALAHRFANTDFAAVYSSDLERARNTTQHIIQYHPETPVTYTDALREKHGGIYEGEPLQQLLNAETRSDTGFKYFAPPRGESFHDVERRATAFYNTVRSQHNGDPVLFVSHGGTINVLIHHLQDKALTRESFLNHQPGNTAVTTAVHNPDPVITRLNCVNHLEGR